MSSVFGPRHQPRPLDHSMPDSSGRRLCSTQPRLVAQVDAPLHVAGLAEPILHGPALHQVIQVVLREGGEEIGPVIDQPLRFSTQDIDERGGRVVHDHVHEAGGAKQLAVLLGLDDVVAGLLDVVLELGRAGRLAPGIVGDHEPPAVRQQACTAGRRAAACPGCA